ncbi:hypothetical protein LCGC14_1789840 [marine sediment metagenome]|uniref:Ice-binding protein C-terminal domain-containing protein n=1 Tax=marine sediment metagenome TaxID=412755 RepID=A0A0F9GSW5_9ZZZZ
MNEKRILMICMIGATALPAASARADDFAPPPWTRGAPLSTSVEWEFLTSVVSHFPSDGTEVPLIMGDFTGPPAASVHADPGFPPTWSIGDGDGEWTAGTGPFSMEFELGNWVDDEPVKFMRIQVTFAGSAPTVTSLGAINDGDFVLGVHVGTTAFSATHVLFEYEFHPNPDFELLTLEIPAGSSIDQVVVDTISMPEPATLALLAIGVLAALRPRRRAS